MIGRNCAVVLVQRARPANHHTISEQPVNNGASNQLQPSEHVHHSDVCSRLQHLQLIVGKWTSFNDYAGQYYSQTQIRGLHANECPF